MRIRVEEGLEELARAAAAAIAERLREAIDVRGSAALAVSGGTTPEPTLNALAALDLDWSVVEVHQVDERVAPAGDPSRNATMIERALVSVRPELQWRPLPVEHVDLIGIVHGWSVPRFDVVQLGLGTDGHTASLVPGDDVLLASGTYAMTARYNGHRRVTLTVDAIRSARHRVWVLAGDAKLDPLLQLLRRDDIPGSLVVGRDDEVFWAP